MTEENNANVVVEAAGLTKVFNDFWGRAKAHAVNGIDFKVRQGKVSASWDRMVLANRRPSR